MKKAFAVFGAILILFAALFIIQPGPFLITKQMTIGASEDAYVDSSTGGSNFGTVSTLEARTWQSLGTFVRRSLIRFDFASLGTVENIIGATLFLTLSSCTITTPVGGTGVSDFATYRITGGDGSSWTEVGATWNANSGALFTVSTIGTYVNNADVCPAANTKFSFDATAAVRSWVIDGASNLGIWLRAPNDAVLPEGADLRYVFISREGGTPLLDIDYTVSGEAPPPGVGPGLNQTQNQTGVGITPPGPSLALAALIFVIAFLIVVVIARRRPALAVGLGALAGIIAAGGYLLLGGS